MHKIRQILLFLERGVSVTEPLSHDEKLELIRLLTKLEDFHESKMY
ncbi:hypothetical protein [Pedobacter quisquiliarum]|jgi:hypothetical protein|nr:hypothetical protein [Pedobacter quisquiliarum]